MSRQRPSFRPFALVTVALAVSGLAAPSTAIAQQVIPISSILPKKPRLSHPLDPALEMARESLSHVQTSVDDYTALFVKRCRVDGELSPLQFAKVKIRNRKVNDGEVTTPMAVYLDFLRPSSVKGREVLWVEGQNDGKLIAHETGFKSLINVSLDPNSYLAMRGQRHPITEIGIENLAAKLLETGERDCRHGECEVEIFQDAKVGDTPCTMLQVVHPNKRPYFDFYRAQVYFDENLNLPVRYVSWSWPESPGGTPVLEEEYTYLRVKVNVGLTDQDFDISHPDYRFR